MPEYGLRVPTEASSAVMAVSLFLLGGKQPDWCKEFCLCRSRMGKPVQHQCHKIYSLLFIIRLDVADCTKAISVSFSARHQPKSLEV